jgi:hypothetical protein
VTSERGGLGRTLVLVRFVVWLVEQGYGPEGAPPDPSDPAASRSRTRMRSGGRILVCDGVQVNLSARHAYLSGRGHNLCPAWETTRVRVATGFRDRLLVPDPLHRQAIGQLLKAAGEGISMICSPAVRALEEWLADESDTGGWILKPYIPLIMVSSVSRGKVPSVGTGNCITSQTHDVVNCGQEGDIGEDGDDDGRPLVGTTTVGLPRECVARHRRCLQHWSSNTPEIHVLHPRMIPAVTSWLERGGYIPNEDLHRLARLCPHICELLVSDAQASPSPAGRRLAVSDDMHNLLVRMMSIVNLTTTQDDEEVPAREETDAREEVVAFELSKQARLSGRLATGFEMFLWVGAENVDAACRMDCSPAHD